MQDLFSAFETAAGITPAKLSLFIRTILLALMFVWAAWSIYGQIQYFRHHGADVEQMMQMVLRILFLLTLMIGLVFI